MEQESFVAGGGSVGGVLGWVTAVVGSEDEAQPTPLLEDLENNKEPFLCAISEQTIVYNVILLQNNPAH